MFGWWPGVLVPIVIFFGLSVIVSASIAGGAVNNLKK